MTGVWVQGQKIAAIGVRAKRWVTYHGVALNVAMDLQPFDAITACGLVGRGLTTVQLMHQAAGMPATKDTTILLEYATALLQAFREVFNVDLDPVHLDSHLDELKCAIMPSAHSS